MHASKLLSASGAAMLPSGGNPGRLAEQLVSNDSYPRLTLDELLFDDDDDGGSSRPWLSASATGSSRTTDDSASARGSTRATGSAVATTAAGPSGATGSAIACAATVMGSTSATETARSASSTGSTSATDLASATATRSPCATGLGSASATGPARVISRPRPVAAAGAEPAAAHVAAAKEGRRSRSLRRSARAPAPLAAAAVVRLPAFAGLPLRNHHAGWSSSIRWAPRLARAERDTLEWQIARDDALEVMTAAAQKHPEISLWGDGEPEVPLVGVPRAELERRVREAVRQYHRAGGQSYVGSTSCPMWRWEGGACWRSEVCRAAPAATPQIMDGHRLKYKRLLVLGSWPDADVKDLEVSAISAARRAAQDFAAVVHNIADDARGFAMMRKHYAFIYVCSTV